MRATQVIVRGSVALAATMLVAAGCVDNDSTIFVRQLQAIRVDDECVITNDPSGFTQSSGTLDVSIGDQTYEACLLIGNQLVPRGDSDRTLPETSRVHFYRIDVEVLDASESEFTSFTVPTSGFADPASGSEPSYGFACAPLIDAGTATGIAPNQFLIARVKVYGRSLGGLELETDWWDFPVFVCNGCIASTCIPPMDCEDDLLPVCDLGQDEAPDCRAVDPNFCP
jgi:hypothetical protein